MSELNVTLDETKSPDNATTAKSASGEKPAWVTPKLEDVSEQVMAQPYIRFT